MRYLKYYESNLNDLTIPKSIQEDICDICVDLVDDGFICSYQWWPPYEKGSQFYEEDKYPYISIRKNSDIDKEFVYSEIEDVVNRLRSYLSQSGYIINIRNQMGYPRWITRSDAVVTMVSIQMIDTRYK